MGAMAEQCRWNWVIASLGLVLLLHSGSVVLALDDGGYCPSYPVDTTWKNSIREDEIPAVQLRIAKSLRILAGTFKQGPKVLFTKPGSESYENQVPGVRLVVMKSDLTDSRNVFRVSVMVTLGFWPKFSTVGLRGGGRGRPTIAPTGDVTIIGDGTFNEGIGNLCVVGCIGSVCKYKLNLTYPSPRTIHQVSAFGSLSSIVEPVDPVFFDPISIHSITDGPYQYTMNSTLQIECSKLEPDVSSGKLLHEEKVCNDGWATSRPSWFSQPFEVNWNPACEGTNCGPFAEIGKNAAGNTSALRFHRTRCDGNRIQGILVFSKFPSPVDPFSDPSASDGILTAEGTWDSRTGRLCMIACRLYGTEDCRIVVSMQFPLTYTVSQRSSVMGSIQSLRTQDDPLYFLQIRFKQIQMGLQFTSLTNVKNQPEYKYTKIDTATKLCALGDKKSSSSYPSGANWRDIEFHAKKEEPKGLARGTSFVNLNLFTVGDQFRTYGQLHVIAGNVTGLGHRGTINVSYSIYYQIGNDFLSTVDPTMSAEGIYDSDTGKLCLIGCRKVDLKMKQLQEIENEKDCEVSIIVQLPPTESKEVLKGTVKSLRIPSDPLYFKQETFSGNVAAQILEEVWRVDLEIVISVAMLSLTVVFIILQLVYSKKYPETLPYISTSMLLLLSLAHMIPLILNFEALFQKKRNEYRVVGRTAGWPEVNEVVVRLITMAAMLLQLRLLQLVMKARIKSRATGDLAAAVHERRVVYVILPIYIVGGLISVLFHALFGFKPNEPEFLWTGSDGGLWWAIKAYGGLVLDFHLFPQLVGNILWGAKEQAPLSRPFYFGMALVRSLPHIYDLCRMFKFIPATPNMYMYANPEWDFYSVTSDILIPSGILLLAILVYMQQRWGGRCLLPRRWGSRFEYEIVDAAPI